jgi:predicted metal-dependent HD superfamily phosphohydrolase
MTFLSSERWARLWHDAALSGNGTAWFDVLADHYEEPHRYYHTSRHIAECLAEFDPVRHLANSPVAVELALWFHDAIYDTHAADNEEQSALLARQCISKAGGEPQLVEAVSDLVLVTRSHGHSRHKDAGLLMDVDLSILGKDEERFWEFEAQVRQEYGWVPEAIFNEKRSEILEGFLLRDRIYTTKWFFEGLEQRARSNLKASVARLRGRG